jgi:hypothetical protein
MDTKLNYYIVYYTLLNYAHRIVIAENAQKAKLIGMPLIASENQLNLDFDGESHFIAIQQIPNIDIIQIELEKQKQYYENLLQQKLAEQKAQLLEEMYAPNSSSDNGLRGIGYRVAKERFESNKN